MNQRWIIGGVIMIIIGLTLGLSFLTSSSATEKEEKELEELQQKEEEEKRTSTKRTTPTEVLVNKPLECVTPCSLYIDFRAQFRTEGRALEIKFPGIPNKWFPYEKDGKFPSPEGAEAGWINFRSPDKKEPHVLVQAYRKVIIGL